MYRICETVSCISVYNNSSKDGHNEITLIVNQEKLNLVEKCELFPTIWLAFM